MSNVISGMVQSRGRLRSLTLLIASVSILHFSCSALAAPVPPPEKLLSDDTLIVVTAPDFSKLREAYLKSPQRQFWNDPAMKPFRESFNNGWDEQFAKPIERELDLPVEDLLDLVQGQATIALTQPSATSGTENSSPGMLLLLDSGDKSAKLSKLLSRLRKKWVDAGRALRTEKVRGLEFSIFTIASNDLPSAVKQFIPQPPEIQELGPDGQPKIISNKRVLIIGQVESLLIIGTSIKPVEKVAVHLTGGAMPSLSDLAAFQASQLTMFRSAPLYGWINIKGYLDNQARKSAEDSDSSSPDPLAAPAPDKVLATTGLSGLKSLSFSLETSTEGAWIRVQLAIPDSSRGGLFKAVGGESKDCNPLPFIPADVARFQRWRIDGHKAWSAFEKMLTDLSPQSLNALNFIFETAGARAKEKDPGFDLKSLLINNIGDDLIRYEMPPTGKPPAALASPQSLVLLGSPQPEQLTAALKNLFVIFPGGDSASEREFLGRKIYSVPAPAVPLPFFNSAPSAATTTLNYAPSGGYVAFSTDATLLEEHLRSSGTQSKTLGEIPGFAEAAQKVLGPGTAVFGFINQISTMRASFETLAKNPNASTNTPPNSNPLPGALGLNAPEKSVKDWMDFSLLPAFEKVEKYFQFTVYGVNVTTEGLNFKLFAPYPGALKSSASATAAAGGK